MGLLERTAYPQLKAGISSEELTAWFTPTPEELKFAKGVSTIDTLLHFMVLFKSFQFLHYFPPLPTVSSLIVNHLAACLNLKAENASFERSTHSLYRHRKAIREYLGVKIYQEEASQLIQKAVEEAATRLDDPADLINLTITTLVTNHFELPAFRTLDELVERVRASVNKGYFKQVASRIKPELKKKLIGLLIIPKGQRFSEFHSLKQIPKRANLSNFTELQKRLEWLLSLVDETELQILLADLPAPKISHFANQAKALSAGEFKEVSTDRGQTLWVCLIYHAQIKTRDWLADMLIKRMAFIHKKGQAELERLRQQQRLLLEEILSMFISLLQESSAEPVLEDAALGRFIRKLFEQQGGIELLLQRSQAMALYNGNNYLPLLPQFYKPWRGSLFKLVRLLKLHSSCQDKTMEEALAFILKYHNSRAKWLPDELDLQFTSEQWRRAIHSKQAGKYRLSHPLLEICVFSQLATELRAGDMWIEGSEDYADFRQQLIPWPACEPLFAGYCQTVELPSSADEFVEQLKSWLTEVASRVDQSFPLNKELHLSEQGEPMLKRVTSRPPSATFAAFSSAVEQSLSERGGCSLLEILTNAHHWTNFTRHFAPLSGNHTKLEDAVAKYILATFCYGSNLGPVQTAIHMPHLVNYQQLALLNRTHVTSQKLEAVSTDLINAFSQFGLSQTWHHRIWAGLFAGY